MKIRSEIELFDYLDNELSWRKRDLITLKKLVDDNSKNSEFLVRLAIPYLYAQWEGFVKNSGTAYLSYIEFLGKNILLLKDNIVALALKKKFKTNEQAKFETLQDIITFLNSNEKATFLGDEIDTKSNLKVDVLKDIIKKLGFDYSFYEGKEKTVIEILLEKRNKIAHGHREKVSVDDFLFLHDEVLMMLDDFKTQIENAVVLKLYEK